MKKIIFILFICLFPAISSAQFQQNSAYSLFSDVKAYQEGDAVTVLIMEDMQAGNSASTANSRATELGGSVEAASGDFGFAAGAELSTGTQFQGKGETKRSESIRSRLSARVVEVDDNGNLRIVGERTTKVNGEEQQVTIKGLVRPVDIQSDNTVFSYNIMDLTLIIEGDGSVSNIQEPGLLTKFFRFLF